MNNMTKEQFEVFSVVPKQQNIEEKARLLRLIAMSHDIRYPLVMLEHS